jgi:hypothetical protein
MKQRLAAGAALLALLAGCCAMDKDYNVYREWDSDHPQFHIFDSAFNTPNLVFYTFSEGTNVLDPTGKTWTLRIAKDDQTDPMLTVSGTPYSNRVEFQVQTNVFYRSMRSWYCPVVAASNTMTWTFARGQLTLQPAPEINAAEKALATMALYGPDYGPFTGSFSNWPFVTTSELGVGVMMITNYDTNLNYAADDADQLGGQLPSYYAIGSNTLSPVVVSNLIAALSNSIATVETDPLALLTNGTRAMGADLPMGGQSITGLGSSVTGGTNLTVSSANNTPLYLLSGAAGSALTLFPSYPPGLGDDFGSVYVDLFSDIMSDVRFAVSVDSARAFEVIGKSDGTYESGFIGDVHLRHGGALIVTNAAGSTVCVITSTNFSLGTNEVFALDDDGSLASNWELGGHALSNGVFFGTFTGNGAGVTNSDHGSLAGRDDDDHTNYTTHAEAVDASGDTMTGTLSMSNNYIQLGTDLTYGIIKQSGNDLTVGNSNGDVDIGVGGKTYTFTSLGLIMDNLLDMEGYRIEDLADPNSGDDAMDRDYADARYVNVTGDTMSGSLGMGSNGITMASSYGLTNGAIFGVTQYNWLTNMWDWGNHAEAGYLTGQADSFWQITAANTNSDYLAATVVSNGTFTTSGAGWATTSGLWTAGTMLCPFGTTTTLTQSNRMAVLTGRVYRVTVDLDVSASGSAEGVLIALGGETNTWTSGGDRTITAEYLITPGIDEGLRIEITPTNDAVYLDNVTVQRVTEGDVRAADDVYADVLWLQGTNVLDLASGDVTGATNKTGSISPIVNGTGPVPGIGPTTNELTNALLAVWANLDTDSTDDGGVFTNRNMGVMTNWQSAAMDGDLDGAGNSITDLVGVVFQDDDGIEFPAGGGSAVTFDATDSSVDIDAPVEFEAGATVAAGQALNLDEGALQDSRIVSADIKDGVVASNDLNWATMPTGLQDGDDTGTDDQTLAEVLTQGSLANGDIDMQTNNLDLVDEVIFAGSAGTNMHMAHLYHTDGTNYMALWMVGASVTNLYPVKTE